MNITGEDLCTLGFVGSCSACYACFAFLVHSHCSHCEITLYRSRRAKVYESREDLKVSEG